MFVPGIPWTCRDGRYIVNKGKKKDKKKKKKKASANLSFGFLDFGDEDTAGADETRDSAECEAAERMLRKQASRLEMVQRWHRATMEADGIDIKFSWGAQHTLGKARAVFDACEIEGNGEPMVAPHGMSIEQQLRHKYVLAVEGVDKSSNIQWVMLSGSVVVMPPPSQESWLLEGRLAPWVHYAPVRPDFRDLKDVVEWLRDNDAYAQKMALASQAYMKQFGDFDYEFRLAGAVLRLYVAYMHAAAKIGRSDPSSIQAPAAVKEKMAMSGKCWQNATWPSTPTAPPPEHEHFLRSSSRFMTRLEKTSNGERWLEVTVPIGLSQGESFFVSVPVAEDDSAFDPNGVEGIPYINGQFQAPLRVTIPPEETWNNGRTFRVNL